MESTAGLILYSAAALLAALWYAVLVLRRRQNHQSPPPLPGPAGLPIVGNLPFLAPDLHAYFARLAAVHGPIFRLRLGAKLGVVVSSPALAREVLRDHDAAFANRDVPAVARSIAYGGNDIVWSPNGPTWRMLRRVCAREVLGPTSLDAVYFLRRREVRATIHRLCEKSSVVDVGAEMFETVMNVITEMLWGGSGEEEDEERLSVGREFREVVAEITELLGKPNVSDFFPGLERFDLQGIQGRIGGMLGRLNGIFVSIIERRIKKGSVGVGVGDGGGDFLHYMLKLEKEGSGDPNTPFTMIHVKSLLMDMVVGGTDTTSNTVEWAMAEMMQKPESIRKAQDELDEVVGKGNVVEEHHIPKLTYLGLVLKEVLRLHPALPLLVPHCPSSSCTIGGYTVPEGSRVFVNVWAIQRDPSVWEDPLEFKPERFASPGKKWDYKGNDFSYFPFGAGRRICAGISMAERMSIYALASLLHSFDWTPAEGEKIDLVEKFGIVLKKANPLLAVPTPRLADPKLYL